RVILRGAVIVMYESHEVDSNGKVTEVRVKALSDEESKAMEGKPNGVVNWVSSQAGKTPATAEVRVYDHLFSVEVPGQDPTVSAWEDELNPKSEVVVTAAYIDASLELAKEGDTFQFERIGYFNVDSDSTNRALV